ncbi:Transposase zinc-binding domain-containing protein [Spirosomataceae bacterium TFI 002]|nr:Transposase zinc-binding domain-containing protein [Spirosomataceae bacterium TFI 002]
MRCHSRELADVITKFGAESEVSSHQRRTLEAIRRCRTAELGGHIDSCDSCGHLRISYNSCRNRHCPKCQGLNREAWIIQQEDQLLPVAHFHVVFTLPHELNSLCMYEPAKMYDLLFKAAWHTLKTLSLDPKWLGAKPAATMLLHTWGQNLSMHPHVHCIVPNGGLTSKGNWQFPKRGKANFLYPVKAMQKLYKGYFMQKLKELLRDPDWKYPTGFPVNKAFTEWKNELYKKDWVVYTKKPFAGVKSVVEYLGRYSHRVAITNQRIRSVTDTHVSFSYKDYRTNGHSKLLTLEGKEFLRRFSQHILPCGFRKVRHFGFIANASKAKSIKTARQALHVKQKELLDKAERRSLAKQRLFKKEADKCPCCKTGVMRTMEILSPARAPPSTLLSRKRVKELLSNY